MFTYIYHYRRGTKRIGAFFMLIISYLFDTLSQPTQRNSAYSTYLLFFSCQSYEQKSDAPCYSKAKEETL